MPMLKKLGLRFTNVIIEVKNRDFNYKVFTLIIK